MMTMIGEISRRRALGLIGAAAALPAAARTAGTTEVSGRAFGTYWRITAPAGAELTRLSDAVSRDFDAIDRVFSPWRGDSAISAFNAAPRGTWRAPPDLARVTARALEVADRSRGAFDPTVGPLVARWGFGPITRGDAPNRRGLSVGPSGLTKTRDGVTLDLCGIAKGWALDRAAERARRQGWAQLLLDIGGEILAIGQHPDARDWRVAVESPQGSGSAVAALRLPDGMAMATSGTRAQSYTLNGQLLSHIIDPATQAPAAGTARSVTVVAPDAMTADSWATALCAAGSETGPALARQQGLSALFLDARGDHLRELRTGLISDLLL